MKIVKRILVSLVTLVLALELLLFITGNSYVNTVLARTIFSGKMGPDIDELKLFPSHAIDTGKPEPWPVSVNYNKQHISDTLLGNMVKYQTVGFLVVKDDSILHEQYWEGYDEHAVTNSFSMAKSINAILIGCALKDGLIKNLDQPVADFLLDFKEGGRSGITIRNLLTMSSGLDFKEDYFSPLAWPAEAYYGKDVNGLTQKAKVQTEAGRIWFYKGGDAQLLGMILKQVTGKKVSDYAAEKLWKPIGAENEAFWSTDEQGMEKVSCCFYATARDFARVAKLYLNDGNWNGRQIVDTGYVRESLAAADLVDRDGKKNDKYGYQWWLMKYKSHPVFYMRGIRGQYVFAVPDLKLIIVRIGHKRAPKAGDELPPDVFIYLDAALDMAVPNERR
jgi:CubicO group peptidase (beta-lactamase class C family)